MKASVVAMILLILIAGCSAPTADSVLRSETDTPIPTITHTPTQSPTETPSPEPTPSGPIQNGIGASITQINVSDGVVLATVKFRNYGDTQAVGDLAWRFVENDSHALIGSTQLEPGETEVIEVPLGLYGDDPGNLTVQVRVNGTVVAERAVINE